MTDHSLVSPELDSEVSHAARARLGGSLGVSDIAFFVISAAAPLTVMAGVAPLAIAAGGIGAPVGYLVAGVILILFAVGFTAMARHVSSGGAFYAYITHGLGRPAGFGAAAVALLSYNCIQIGIYGLLASAAQDTIRALFGMEVPWPPIAVLGALIVWFAGYRSIDFGAKILGVLLVAEVGILTLLAIGVLAHGGAGALELSSFSPANVFAPGMAVVLAFAFAAFVGFESTAIYRREAREPARTIPRATYLAVGFLAIFYSFIVWVLIEAYGPQGVLDAVSTDPNGVFFAATSRYVGDWAADLMHVLIVTSVLAAQIAFHNAVNRYTHALSKERVLPAGFSRVHPKHRSPWVAGVAQTALAVAVVVGFAVAGSDPYTQLLLWVNTPGIVGLLFLQMLVAAAVPLYFRRVRHTEGAMRTTAAPLGATVLLAAALCLVVSKIDLFTGTGVGFGVLLVLPIPLVFLAGLAVAAWWRRREPAVYACFGAEEAAD